MLETEPVPVLTVLEAGWATGPVWMGSEYFASTVVRTLSVQP